ncbi:MAG: HD-GYP domain-containing protein [Azonexus sp.]|nr:HD-GYP domain-containing protein [Azonexus sp.]
MIRKLSVHDLLPGMYVVDLHQSWLAHSVWRRRFKVDSLDHVRKLIAAGIEEVSIDTARGIDLPPPPAAGLHDIAQRIARQPVACKPAPATVSLGEERRRAGRLLQQGVQLLDELTLAARVGRAVEVACLEPVISKMMESVARNPDALVPLARLKRLDAYATEHAVATAGLIIALGRQQGVGAPELEKMALGTMLKDIGHAAIDARLTDKRGQLSQQEFSIVQGHVEEGLAVLEATTSLPETTVAVVLEHHERYNGSGYPYRMAGDEISLAGRLAAIVDTYDAMTSHRPYRAAMSPTEALRQLYEQGGAQYDPNLVAGLVKTLGIYPVGTLVLLESGHLAVVESLHPDNLLSPVVNVIYHSGRRQYVAPVRVDLARTVGNHYGQILRAEDFGRWGLSPTRWQPA